MRVGVIFFFLLVFPSLLPLTLYHHHPTDPEMKEQTFTQLDNRQHRSFGCQGYRFSAVAATSAAGKTRQRERERVL